MCSRDRRTRFSGCPVCAFFRVEPQPVHPPSPLNHNITTMHDCEFPDARIPKGPQRPVVSNWAISITHHHWSSIAPSAKLLLAASARGGLHEAAETASTPGPKTQGVTSCGSTGQTPSGAFGFALPSSTFTSTSTQPHENDDFALNGVCCFASQTWVVSHNAGLLRRPPMLMPLGELFLCIPIDNFGPSPARATQAHALPSSALPPHLTRPSIRIKSLPRRLGLRPQAFSKVLLDHPRDPAHS